MTWSRDPWENDDFELKYFSFIEEKWLKSCRDVEKYKNLAQIEVIKAGRRSWLILCRCYGRICWGGTHGRGSWRCHQVWWQCRFYNNARIIVTIKHGWSCSVCILFAILFGISFAFCCIICVLFKRTYRFRLRIFGVISKENWRYYLVKWRTGHLIGIFILKWNG